MLDTKLVSLCSPLIPHNSQVILAFSFYIRGNWGPEKLYHSLAKVLVTQRSIIPSRGYVRKWMPTQHPQARWVRKFFKASAWWPLSVGANRSQGREQPLLPCWDKLGAAEGQLSAVWVDRRRADGLQGPRCGIVSVIIAWLTVGTFSLWKSRSQLGWGRWSLSPTER